MKFMDLLNLVNASIVMLGIPTIIVASVYLGRKLEVLDGLVDTVNNRILPKLQEIELRLTEVERKLTVMDSKLDILWSWFSKNVLPLAKLDIATK
jgi:hypothetical protein